MTRKILLAGASGLVGSFCLEALLVNNAEEIHVLVRKPLVKYPSSVKNLHQHVINFDELENLDSLFGADTVICCLGTTLKQAGSIKAFRKVDFDYCLNLARLAKQFGVKHFLIITAVNSNSKSRAYYSKIKGQLQNELIALALPKLSIFQPSLLLGERNEFRFGEALGAKAAKFMNTVLPNNMSKYKAIDGAVVGRAMAKLALDPESFDIKNKISYIHFDSMLKLASL